MLEQMQSTMRHLFLGDMSRNDGAMGAIAGRYIAMKVKTSTCHTTVARRGALCAERQRQEGEQQQQVYWSQRHAEEKGVLQGQDRIQGYS